MTDWLTPSSNPEAVLSTQHILLRLIASLILGSAVAIIFRMSHGRQHERATTLTTTLVLLSVLIAMVSMVIGSSVAMAFSLVGALSIVRFRTVVEDTRDTAFVIFAVVVGMSAGSGQLLVPLIGLPTVGLTAVALSRLQSESSPLNAVLTIRIGLGRDPEQLLHPVFTNLFKSFQLKSASTTKQGAAIELQYHVLLNSLAAISNVVICLNQTDGVQSVEIKADS
jgi:Domain of unknown function (DUF4956)